MTGPVAQQRCFVHADREAAARCPHCTRFFCRECVTEHDDRVICASCLRALSSAKPRHRATALLLTGSTFALGFLTLWISFHAIGRALLRIPSSFHKTSLWQDKPADPFEPDIQAEPDEEEDDE